MLSQLSQEEAAEEEEEAYCSPKSKVMKLQPRRLLCVSNIENLKKGTPWDVEEDDN